MEARWHPQAVRRIHINAGGFQGGGHKIVWHTTEGSSLPNYGGSAPHFTLDPANGRLWQHIPLDRAARALKAGGPELLECHPSGTDRFRRGEPDLAPLALHADRKASPLD